MSFDSIPLEITVSVSVEEVERPTGRYLRGTVYRRIGASAEWLFDGVEAIDVPLERGEAIARVVLAEQLRKRFGVAIVADSAVPS
jgi:hypothetical protein